MVARGVRDDEYKIRQSRIEAALVDMERKIPESSAYRLLEPGNEVIAVLFLLETREGHLGTRNVLKDESVDD